MKTWPGLIRRRLQWLGWPAIAALAVAIFTAGVQFGLARPAQHELSSLQHSVAALRSQLALSGASVRQNPRVQLVRFYQSFPPGGSVPDSLELIYAIARANHLELTEGDYRISQRKHGQLSEYQLTLPIKGSYPSIRDFLNTVLSQLPSASLDNVAFERPKIGEPAVQVTVHLTLYLRGGL